MEEKRLYIEMLILILLIFLNAFFAASEIALITLNDNKVKMMADAGDNKAKMLHNLLGEPSRFLATIQIGITLAGFLASAFAAESFAGRLAQFLYSLGVPLPGRLLETFSVVIITLVLSYFTLVLGELVPKRLAMKKAEPISRLVVRPLTLLSKVTSPFVKLLTHSTNIIVKLFGVDPHAQDEEVTEEEIRMMVDVGEERGAIQDTEKMMINNIFEFDNKTVSEIMTHRTNIVAIPLHYSLKEIIDVIHTEKYSRFPVYKNDIDNIIGVLHVKDLLRFMNVEKGFDGEFNLKDIIRVPSFIPISRKADSLFAELQKTKVHMAVIIDEYGGTFGIVTIEDLLEEIVGNIFDEYDEEDDEVIKLDENTLIMDGTLSLHDVERHIKIKFPTEQYDTLSGFLIGQIGNIPNVQQKVQIIKFDDYIFTIEQADEKRITKVKVSRA
jgi:putative hemolysin